MKKILVVLLVFCILMMTACKSAEEVKSEQEAKYAADYVEVVFSSELIQNYNKDDYGNQIDYHWNSDTNNYPDFDAEIDVTIDGVHISSGDKVSKLIDNGFYLADAYQKLEAGEKESSLSCDDTSNGCYLTISIYNSSDKAKARMDCEIIEMHITSLSMDTMDYKGLTKDSSLMDIKFKLGLPVSIEITSASIRLHYQLSGSVNPYGFATIDYNYSNNSIEYITLHYEDTSN